MVAFSDAIVAIAITVLILPLTDLNLGELSDKPVSDLLNRYGYLLMGFGISWVVIIIFWMKHHRLFGLVGRIDSGLIWWNTAWLFGIAVFPFPADLVGQVGESAQWGRFAASLYAGDLLFISVAGMMTWRRVGKVAELQNERARSYPQYFHTTRGYFATAVFVVVLIAAQFIELNALWLIWLLLLMDPVGRRLDRKLFPEYHPTRSNSTVTQAADPD